MQDDKIRASVGMTNNGTTLCYNLPQDVATIVKLLNTTDRSEGGSGRTENQLPPTASARQLYVAILRFQQTQNRLYTSELLSEDGHVDPYGRTLARLNRMARRLGPIDPHDGPVIPPELPFPPPRKPSPASTNFRIRFKGGVSIGEGLLGDALVFQIWDTHNSLTQFYSYGGGGVGFGIPKVPGSFTFEGPWDDFLTIKPVPVGIFAGPAHWTSGGGAAWSANILQLFFIAGTASGVQIFVRTGMTLGAGFSSSFGMMAPMGETLPFTGI